MALTEDTKTPLERQAIRRRKTEKMNLYEVEDILEQ